VLETAIFDMSETYLPRNVFNTIAVSGQSNVVADSSTDTLTLVAGSNITITTDAGTDSITITGNGWRVGIDTATSYGHSQHGDLT